MSDAGRPGCIDTARLARCLNPQSIAVIGGMEAARVIQQCRKLNYAGAIWPVNPKRRTLEGLACHPDIAALPAPPDAAFIAIPAHPSIDAVAALARAGAGGAVCYASGFRETGGEERHRLLVRAAASMPVIGPNCYGFINLLSGVALWPDYHGAARMRGGAGGVAIFSQSGNVSLNLTMQRRHLPLAWLISLGNQAVVGVEDCIAAALQCAQITAIGLHIEGLNDLPRFAHLAEQARCRGVPMVALKAGRSAIGARITLSHTATLAGEDALYDALFQRLGVARVATPEALIEALKLLSVTGPLPGNRIASMSCSGGEATLVADLAAAHLHAPVFPALDERHRRAVQATLGDAVTVDNPLDYHTFIWGDQARMTATFRAMLAGGFDLTLLVLDIPGDDREAMDIWLRAVRAFIDACDHAGAGGALVTLLSENLPEQVGRLLLANNIAPLQGLAQGLAAVVAACDIGRAWAGRAPPPSLAAVAAPGEGFSTVDEHRAKQRLAAAGLPVPQSQVVDSPDAAVAAAARLGNPVAVKALAAHIAHKTEAGAVAVGLRADAEVRGHAARMLSLSGRLLIEEMVEDAVAELLLGVGCDRQFGHYLIIGLGGQWVELFGDRQLLLPPVNRAMIAGALARLKTAAVLHGYRGRPAADVDAVVDCALRLSRLVENEPDIIEVEINPLMVKSPSQSGAGGAVAADALMTTRGEHGEHG